MKAGREGVKSKRVVKKWKNEQRRAGMKKSRLRALRAK